MSSCDRDRRDPRGLGKADKLSHATEADGRSRFAPGRASMGRPRSRGLERSLHPSPRRMPRGGLT